MLDSNLIPSIDVYVAKVVGLIKSFEDKIVAAPAKSGGWNKDAFGNSVKAKWQLKSERSECLKAVAESAAFFGYNLSDEFADFKAMT